MKPSVLDQGTYFVWSDCVDGNVRGRVVAVRDHGLEHAAGGGRALQIDEHGTAGRPDIGSDVQLGIFGEASRLDFLQVLRKNEGLDCTTHKKRKIGVDSMPY